MDLYDRIKELCTNAKMTIAELEIKALLSNGSIGKWKKSVPKADTLNKVAQILNTSLEYLLTGNKFVWNDEVQMGVVDEELLTVFKITLEATGAVTAESRKMIFDIMVELRHVLATKQLNENSQAVALGLIQNAIALSTQFIDACASITEPAIESERINKLLITISNKFSDVLNDTKNNISK